MGELNRAIEAEKRKLTGVRESFTAAVAPLVDVLAGPVAFDAARIEAAIRQLTAEHEQARRRLAFLEEWTQFLSRESGQLRDRLAQYVNLLCATTVGIATDEYFGDKGAFVEKQFDVLVIDEAGKVTEPEFLVAAVRAKRWVLVGDHKQLPPYYDQLLDPYLHSANETRKAADQPMLDPQALRLSIFERLWWRFNPGRQPAFQQADAAAAESSAGGGRAQGEGDDAMHLDPSVSWDAAYDQAEQSDKMWQSRQTERACDKKRRDDQLEEMWVQQRSGRAGTPPRSTPPKGPEGNAASPNPAGASRCVTLDVQRRMHPDLAVL